MDLGGVVMDAVGGGAELGLLGGSRLLKHGRGNAAAGVEEHLWGGRAKQARVSAAGDVAEAAAKAAAAPFLLGSCSPGHGGEQMLSFSSAASSCPSAAAGAAAADAAMPLYYGTPASCSGEDERQPVVQSFFFRCLLDWIWSLEKLAIHSSSSFPEYRSCFPIHPTFSLCALER